MTVYFDWYPNLENLEDAISRVRTSLNYSSPGDEDYSFFTQSFATLVDTRTKHFHISGDPQRATFSSSQQFVRLSLQPTGTTEEDFVGLDKIRDVREAYSTEIIEQ